MQKTEWWKKAVVYQIYPRSFQDSNGDGVGDIPGIISRLDYLHHLGINAIWLSPIYASPNDDNGYDISDYEAIQPEFGTMADMEDLISRAKKLGIKIIMDLVVNHTSSEHYWFKEACKSVTSPFHNYYVWVNGEPNHLPNDLKSTFGGPAWTYVPALHQYYLHLFSSKQPDLNWENPVVRQQVYSMMNFWIAKGVGGFRMDVIDLIGKVPLEGITANGPHLHQYLKEMNENTFGKYDLMTVGETWGATPEIAEKFSASNRHELSMVFQFEHSELDQVAGKEKWDLKPLSVPELKQVFSKWQTELDDKGWNSLFWNNHDLPRIVSRWGNDKEFRVQSAKMFGTILHCLKGTPYIYQGEELGMTNCPISTYDEIDDIESRNLYQIRLAQGYSKDEIIKSINAKGRDNARTPMQWNADENGGFSTTKPWLHVNQNYHAINAAAELEDPDSTFNYYRRLIALRRDNPIITTGRYQLITDTADDVFAYLRIDHKTKLLVVANFSPNRNVFSYSATPKKLLISNYPKHRYTSLKSFQLEPYESFAIELD